MKLNNKILEAIDRGILLALDDYDDTEVQSHKKVANYDDKGTTKALLKLLNKLVDMGLPSGTLWCKCNIKAVNEREPGNYFAWGELRSKKLYGWKNYKLVMPSINKILKYSVASALCNDPDNITELLPEDDIATKTLGPQFHIPTKEQWDELYRNCDWKFENVNEGKYVNDRYCIIFTSKINGNTLILPAAGYFFSTDASTDHSVKGFNDKCMYWSSTLCKRDITLAYAFSKERIRIIGSSGVLRTEDIIGFGRARGLPIRAVFNC